MINLPEPPEKPVIILAYRISHLLKYFLAETYKEKDKTPTRQNYFLVVSTWLQHGTYLHATWYNMCITWQNMHSCKILCNRLHRCTHRYTQNKCSPRFCVAVPLSTHKAQFTPILPGLSPISLSNIVNADSELAKNTNIELAKGSDYAFKDIWLITGLHIKNAQSDKKLIAM
jgi:hypothetical protein